jgi:hypothetical protein
MHPTRIQDDERSYDTEIEDKLELLSTPHLSGSKELRANQLENEINPKNYKTVNLSSPTLNE